MRKIRRIWYRIRRTIKKWKRRSAKEWMLVPLQQIKKVRFASLKRCVIAGMVLFCGLFGELEPGIFLSSSLMATNIYNSESVRVVYQTTESEFYNYPVTKQTNTSQKKGPSYLYSKATDGELGFTYTDYQLTYDMMGRLLMREPISESVTQQAQDIEYRKGSKVKKGAYYYPVYSRYGVDCEGCTGEKTGHGNFACGVHYDKNKGVRQFDGTYKQGVTYEGYYIIAADPKIPFCTVLEIENHRFEGAGIENNEPFRVVVLDRGGAIQGRRIDLFIGLQTDMQIGYGKWKTSKKTKATIIKFGKWTTNSLGQRGCKL